MFKLLEVDIQDGRYTFVIERRPTWFQKVVLFRHPETIKCHAEYFYSSGYIPSSWKFSDSDGKALDQDLKDYISSLPLKKI